jgi:cytochrome b involved in lipid metabolism
MSGDNARHVALATISLPEEPKQTTAQTPLEGEAQTSVKDNQLLDEDSEDDQRRCSMRVNAEVSEKAAAASARARVVQKAAGPPKSSNPFSRFGVSRHCTEGDLWVIVRNKIFDLTHFHLEHPGGAYAIFQCAGADATKEFESNHDASTHWSLLMKHFVSNVSDD